MAMSLAQAKALAGHFSVTTLEALASFEPGPGEAPDEIDPRILEAARIVYDNLCNPR